MAAGERSSGSLIDPAYEMIDPTPDLHSLFFTFNQQFFGGLLSMCEVKWSTRMTSCAGVCSYEGNGGLCSIRISKPLLIYRPRKDLVETLLHEMIHAYLFVTERNRDRDGHGPNFKYHMYRINAAAGTNITIYHNFYAEVANYKKHWWRCNGICRFKPPYYGWVKRAMNRAPSKNDFWWASHENTCRGKFIKVKEPSGFGEKAIKNDNDLNRKKTMASCHSRVPSMSAKSVPKSTRIVGNLSGWLSGKPSGLTAANVTSNSKDASSSVLGVNGKEKSYVQVNSVRSNRPIMSTSDTDVAVLVECPSCNEYIVECKINHHLDTCLSS